MVIVISGTPASGEMHERIEVLYPQFANVEHDVLKVIDSTNQNIEETVEEIYNLLPKVNY